MEVENIALNLIKKLIKGRNYMLRFNSNVRDKENKEVNALIKKENNKVIIEININSIKTIEFLVIHEITHDIVTKDMRDLIYNYSKKDNEFKNKLNTLKERYNTNDISEEVIADICGKLLGNKEFIKSVIERNPNIFYKELNKKYILEEYVSFIKELGMVWLDAFYSSRSNLNETKYAQKSLKDGTNYIETEKNLFIKDNGTPMSQREIYNSLIGKQITFNDEITVTIKQWLPSNKNMYNELFRRYPTYKDVKDIKKVNNNINENIVELLKASHSISPNEPDYMERHKNNKIVSFATRKVSFYDGENAYDLDFSIAKMQDGNYVAYAKKSLFLNNTLLNKIKKETPTSKSRGVLPYANNIPRSKTPVK